MLATCRFNGVILVTRLPAPAGTLDKSEFEKFSDAAGYYRQMATNNSGRVEIEVIAVFSIGKNEQRQEVMSLVPFPMSRVECPYADIQVVELHDEYRAHIEQAYRQNTSGIIL